MKDVLDGYRILIGNFFQNFIEVIPLSSGFHYFFRKSHIPNFFLCLLLRFSLCLLSLFLERSNESLSVVFFCFCFFLLRVHRNHRTGGFRPFWKILACYPFNVALAHFLFSHSATPIIQFLGLFTASIYIFFCLVFSRFSLFGPCNGLKYV